MSNTSDTASLPGHSRWPPTKVVPHQVVDMSGKDRTTVFEVSGLQWATSKASVEATLSRRPGVLAVAANPVAQSATVTYDPARTTVAELAEWVRECGYHCAGRSVPQHVCDPMTEPQDAAVTPMLTPGT